MSDEKLPQPTASEAMFFFSIVKNMKTQAEIDWTLVAEDRGLKNAEVAKVRFGQVKRKLGIGAESIGAKASPKKASSRTTTPTKVTKTPAKRSSAKSRMAKMKKEDSEEEDSKDEDMADAEARTKVEPDTDATVGDPF